MVVSNVSVRDEKVGHHLHMAHDENKNSRVHSRNE